MVFLSELKSIKNNGSSGSIYMYSCRLKKYSEITLKSIVRAIISIFQRKELTIFQGLLIISCFTKGVKARQFLKIASNHLLILILEDNIWMFQFKNGKLKSQNKKIYRFTYFQIYTMGLLRANIMNIMEKILTLSML